jgi:hypothetical protein
MGSVLQQWLPVHAELLHSLRFQQLSELDCSRPEQQQQVACMAAGLQAAAAARGARPLQLSSLSCDTCCKLLLEVLPVSCSAITHLELGPFCSDVLQQHLCSITTAQDQATRLHASTGHNRQEICNMGTNTRQHSMQPMNKAPPVQQQEVRVHNALASLPHLHSLVLFGFAANTLLATLPACTQLQRLELQNLVCSHAQWLHSLPAQLKVRVVRGVERQLMQLQVQHDQMRCSSTLALTALRAICKPMQLDLLLLTNSQLWFSTVCICIWIAQPTLFYTALQHPPPCVTS